MTDTELLNKLEAYLKKAYVGSFIELLYDCDDDLRLAIALCDRPLYGCSSQPSSSAKSTRQDLEEVLNNAFHNLVRSRFRGEFEG